jgi:hypothetical protein
MYYLSENIKLSDPFITLMYYCQKNIKLSDPFITLMYYLSEKLQIKWSIYYAYVLPVRKTSY